MPGVKNAAAAPPGHAPCKLEGVCAVLPDGNGHLFPSLAQGPSENNHSSARAKKDVTVKSRKMFTDFLKWPEKDQIC